VTHVISVLISGLITSPGYEFILLQLLAGLVVVFSRFDTRYWGNFYQSIASIIVVYMLGYIGISFIEEPNFALIKWSVLIWLALNGFLTLLAYPLIPLFGNLFGFISSITLAELSDLGHPLLKELSMKAPGTLQHSLQVANLSEAAAVAIGANDLLVKVGALYHDVGKTANPQYFIENQSGTNAHDLISPLESATIIMSHVTEGVKMAEKLGLPQPIIRFIQTHHGTTAVEFFYRLHLEELRIKNSKLISENEGEKTTENAAYTEGSSLELKIKNDELKIANSALNTTKNSELNVTKNELNTPIKTELNPTNSELNLVNTNELNTPINSELNTINSELNLVNKNELNAPIKTELNPINSELNNVHLEAIERIKFIYSGPKPKTREETILMLADSLEAAAKSMKNPTSESIDTLVTKIIDHKINQGQLADSALTFNELELCKASFKKTLKSIHHVRIEYPSVKN
jgi:putative nucleotidyltransferase with HDIG domain